MIKRVLKEARSSSLANIGSLVLVIASMVVNCSNFVYHIIVSRDLTPGSYGALGALLGLLLLFGVPASALQVAITKEVAAKRAENKEPNSTVAPIAAGPLFTQSLIWGIGVMIVLLAMSPFIKQFLHLPSISSAMLLAVYVVPSALGLVPRAILLGELRFILVAFALAIGALVRLALSALFAHRSGVNGALAATILGELVTTAVMLPSIRSLVKPQQGQEPLTVHWSDAVASIIAFSGYWMLTGIDTFLARHFLTSNDSGFYAAAATGARSAMFLPAAIALVAFPLFAENGGRTIKARSALIHALMVVSLLSLAAAGVLAAFPHVLINILFSDKYSVASTPMVILSFGAAALGIVNLLMQYHLATRARAAAALPWVGVLLAVVAIFAFHDSMSAIAVVMVVISALLLLVMTKLAFGQTKFTFRNMEGLSHQLWDIPEAELELTMVVPYFNPGDALVATVRALDETLQRVGTTYEIIAVSDGSTDNSHEMLEALKIPSVQSIKLAHNAGKGQALRTGMAMGRGRYLGFIDADGDVDPSLLEEYLTLVRLYQPDIILGSKRHPMSEVHYPILRHVYSVGYQLLTYALFRTNVRDTQTGLKLVRREVLIAALPRMVEKRFAFDLELLVVAKHLGFGKFFEAPIKIQYHFKSTVSVLTVKGMLMDSFAIFYRLRLLRAYDQPNERVVAPRHHESAELSS
jgi:O-antigen/teichoic acid export membrane protein/glycosyltransferase involved in cell wall biosynthesis